MSRAGLDLARAPIAVIGLGNVLLGDDGFGPFVVDVLGSQWTFGDEVELIDAGTPGLGLATYVSGRETLILLDTVAATGSPGELRLYRGEELRALPTKPRVSPHDPALGEALAMTALAGSAPREVLLLGVIPESTAMGTELSEPVRRAAALAGELVPRWISRAGGQLTARSGRHFGDVWWTRPVRAHVARS
ncbi:MAG: hydrogenase maturation protease [Deltaproteobacteria bacterium]|nr:hydrogenase maturation protease [Deltaproteobacteria bacterium]